MKTASLRKPMLALAVLGLAAGCNKKDNSRGNFTSAVDGYYSTHPECLWPEPHKLPAQSDTNGGEDTAKYDALVDAGLLTRQTAEKQKLIILSKQVNIYDLSSSGRTSWNADSQQPGYGNLCYGHRKVQDITAFNPAGTQPGATTSVTYTYRISDVAAWARAAETQTAFPALATAIAGPNTAQANLLLTTEGWRVQPSYGTGRSSAEGTIVQ